MKKRTVSKELVQKLKKLAERPIISDYGELDVHEIGYYESCIEGKVLLAREILDEWGITYKKHANKKIEIEITDSISYFTY